MAKRFTSTDKYKNKFFRNLPGPYKLFWDYLYHDCNHAGIWIVNFEIAQIYIGKDMLIEEYAALELFNADKERIFPISDGDKWFILPFIENQYGKLNPDNRVHSSVIKTLEGYDIDVFESIPSSAKNIDPEEEARKKRKNSPFKVIFDYWNSCEIVIHRAFTTQMKGKINAKLKDYSPEEICNTIKNYASIVKDKKYFFEYKWTLVDFFSRGFDKFFDENTARANYRINKKKGPKREPVNPSSKKAKVEMKPKE